VRHSDEEIKEAAARFERIADEVDRNPDAAKIEYLADLGAVASATEEVRAAQARLVQAVEISRGHGRSWNELAVPLGVSRQAARQRFANEVSLASTLPKPGVRRPRKAAGTQRVRSGTAEEAPAKKVAGRNPTPASRGRQSA
jgi:hypothetical protein